MKFIYLTKSNDYFIIYSPNEHNQKQMNKYFPTYQHKKVFCFVSIEILFIICQKYFIKVIKFLLFMPNICQLLYTS